MSEFKSGFFVGGDACNGRVLVVDDEPDIRKVGASISKPRPGTPSMCLSRSPSGMADAW